MTEKEIKQLQAENAALREEVSRLKDEMVRLVSRNLDLSERFEDDVTLRLRVAAAREMMENNLKRQRNADLQDDGQLLAIIEMKLEQEQPHLNADFDGAALAELMGVSQERLSRLFHHMALYRTPNAYLDNLRTLTAMRLLREKPNYNIATVAEEAGFNNVRTMQRKITDAIDMTPAEYRALFTRDL
jgi:transcriptional regulator GlxA family with amidase domain